MWRLLICMTGNTDECIGMGHFADGRTLVSKPYTVLAKTINKMSNRDNNGVYNPWKRIPEKAYPFNFFY